MLYDERKIDPPWDTATARQANESNSDFAMRLSLSILGG